jgi:hypothetical protein
MGAPAADPFAVLGVAVLGAGAGRADARADACGVGTAGRGKVILGAAVVGACVVGVVVVDAAGKAGEKPDAASGNAGEGGNVCACGPVGPATHNQKPTDRSPTAPATTDFL